MHIAICEDHKDHAVLLTEMIKRWAKNEILIDVFFSAEQFLFRMQDKTRYDIVFLDINLEKINGFELAKMIRDEDKSTLLIFTTGIADMAHRGYEVSAFRYLMKPLKEKEVEEALNKAEYVLETTRRESIIVEYDEGLRRIFKADICYLEAEDHFLSIHTREQVFRIRSQMKKYEEKFSEPQFCKCHRSYIVNMQYVEQLTRKNVVMEDGDVLPVSRNKWEGMNQCYLAYYIE